MNRNTGSGFDKPKNFFPLPNEIFSLGLHHSEIAIYSYLMHCEDRSTYQCYLCACGCGKKVVLPIAPDFWSVKYNGEAVSLFPSIGNFQFPCKSHYWIRENVVVWADDQHQKDDYNAFFLKEKNDQVSGAN